MHKSLLIATVSDVDLLNEEDQLGGEDHERTAHVRDTRMPSSVYIHMCTSELHAHAHIRVHARMSRQGRRRRASGRAGGRAPRVCPHAFMLWRV